ncbi:MAG: hypothetical protein ABSD68_00425 [Candidatus Micrarchaeales archaeon]
MLKKKELETGDTEVINKARLVAALSSNHSWRVFRFLHNGDAFDRAMMREEIRVAFNEGWKEINENDVKEVANLDIEEHALCMVFMCLDEKDGRNEYKELVTHLQEEFVDGIEPIETREFA